MFRDCEKYGSCMNSISSLSNCAEGHLNSFVSPTSLRSFRTYDRRGTPGVLEPLDVLAPTLLDAPIRREEINRMFSLDPSDAFHNLKVKIETCLKAIHRENSLRKQNYCFGEIDFLENEETGYSKPRELWELVRACFIASDATPNIKATKVSKILHRKEPEFIPIIDSKLVSFYGISISSPGKYWPVLQKDFLENQDLLDGLSKNVLTSDGEPLSSLRVADIVIWEHVVSGCTSKVH